MAAAGVGLSPPLFCNDGRPSVAGLLSLLTAARTRHGAGGGGGPRREEGSASARRPLFRPCIGAPHPSRRRRIELRRHVRGPAQAQALPPALPQHGRSRSAYGLGPTAVGRGPLVSSRLHSPPRGGGSDRPPHQRRVRPARATLGLACDGGMGARGRGCGGSHPAAGTASGTASESREQTLASSPLNREIIPFASRSSPCRQRLKTICPTQEPSPLPPFLPRIFADPWADKKGGR